MDIKRKVERVVLSAGGSVRTGAVRAALKAEGVEVSQRSVMVALGASDKISSEGRGWWRTTGTPPARLARVTSPKLPPSSPEIGATGTDTFQGMLGDTDYNADLQAPGLYAEYDRMRLSDGTVRGGIEAIKQPLMAAAWFVSPASDSPEDVEIAEFVQANLIDGGMTTSWDDTLRNILLFLDYGSMPMEPVWEIRDWRGSPAVWLRKLAPRLPATITEWRLDDNGGLLGIVQDVIKGTATEQLVIPRDKLLLFVHQQEASNFRGHSILRAARKHWDIKRKLEIVDAIGIEKRNNGVDIGTMKGPTDPALKSASESVLRTIHSHDKMYVNEHEDKWTYRVQGIEGQTLPAKDSIDYHDRMILRAIGDEFVAIGGTGGGSFAMHQDKSSLFIMSLAGIAKLITNAFNAYLIPQWVGRNWSTDRFPKLSHKRLDTRDATGLANAVAGLVNAGTLKNTEQLEDSLLGELDLPVPERVAEDETTTIGGEKDVQKTALNGAQVTAAQGIVQAVADGNLPRDSAHGMLIRFFQVTAEEADQILGSVGQSFTGPSTEPAEQLAMTGAGEWVTTPRLADRYGVPDRLARAPSREVVSGIDAAEIGGADVRLAREAAHLFARAPRGVEYRVNFAKIDTELDRGAERIVEAASDYQQELVASVWAQIEAAFKDGTVADLSPESFKVPPIDDALGLIQAELMRTAAVGEREATKELERQGAKPESLRAVRLSHSKLAIDGPEVGNAAYFLARARQYMETVIARVRNVASARALDAAATGALDAGVLATLTGLADSVLATESTKLVTSAMAAGRDVAQTALSAAADHAVYSSLLDESTCPQCRAVDERNTEYAVPSAEYRDHYPPLKSAASGVCRGFDRCRCIMILVLRDELAS